MKIERVLAKTIPISRYADRGIPPQGLTTTLVAVDAGPVTGYGFASIGRFAATGLIQDRFAQRLLDAGDFECPTEAWVAMMRNEKPGGHGERCVAVGALDMALWDAAAKLARRPLFELLAERFCSASPNSQVPVYAGGGYRYPTNDESRLRDEVQLHLSLGHTRVKIKIGGRPLAEDLRRIETALKVLPDASQLAVDAMNCYTATEALAAASSLGPLALAWFEDAMDPLDFEAHRSLAATYQHPLGLGEATFSQADARNLIRYAGLRRNCDMLIFDPVHCYGLPGYLKIIEEFESVGWSRAAFWPHGGHLFSLHVAAGLRLGGCEDNPGIFQPVGGFGPSVRVHSGIASPPDVPGIGFETMPVLLAQFEALSS